MRCRCRAVLFMACGNLVVTSRRPMQRPRSPGTFLFHDSIRFGFFTFLFPVRWLRAWQVRALRASGKQLLGKKVGRDVTRWPSWFTSFMLFVSICDIPGFPHAGRFCRACSPIRRRLSWLLDSRFPRRVGSDGAALEQGGIDGFAPWSWRAWSGGSGQSEVLIHCRSRHWSPFSWHNHA